MTTDNHDQALEARARALLKSECPECGGAGYTEDDDGSVRCQTCLNDYDVNKAQAIRAIVSALREARVPEGYVVVPVEPTETQWGGLARDIVMWMQAYDRHTPSSLRTHLERCGQEITARLDSELGDSRVQDHAMEKGTIACIIYKAMIYAAGTAGGE